MAARIKNEIAVGLTDKQARGVELLCDADAMAWSAFGRAAISEKLERERDRLEELERAYQDSL